MPEVFISDMIRFLPEGILLGVGLLILLLDPFCPEPKKSLLEKGAMGGFLLSTVATLWLWRRGATFFGSCFGGLYILDGFALFFKLIFLVSAMLTLLVSSRYLALVGIPRGEYLALILFATVGMMVMAAGIDFLSIYLGLEVMALSSYALVGLLKKDRASLEGALKYFLLGAFNSGVILYGIALLYGVTNTTSLAALKDFPPFLYAPGSAVLSSSVLGLLAVALLIAGFAFKISAFPFHMWVPDAYEGSPTPIAGFISVASKAASFAALLRLSLVLLSPIPNRWQMLIVLLSTMTMTFGNLLALSQESLKRMLAYSSIAHAGYLLIGLAVGSSLGISALLFYFVAYACMNLGSFAMLVLLVRKGRRAETLEDFRGLAKEHPVWAFCFLVFLLSLTGIPPTAGFVGKFYLFAGAVQSGLYGLAVIAVLNSVLAMAYYFRVVRGMYMTEGDAPLEVSPSFGLRMTLILLALSTLLIGLYPVPFLALAQQATHSLL